MIIPILGKDTEVMRGEVTCPRSQNRVRIVSHVTTDPTFLITVHYTVFFSQGTTGHILENTYLTASHILFLLHILCS